MALQRSATLLISRLSLIVLVVSCLNIKAFAQSCGTSAIYQSEYFKVGNAKEEQSKYIAYTQATSHKSASAKYIIPVVVHIVHQGGFENISDSQVISAITALNNDYRKIPGTKGFTGGVDTEIEFALASIDPFGNTTTGITRDSSSYSNVYYAAADSMFFANDSLMKTSFGWPPDQYLNFFIVGQIDNGNILGYAFYPPYMAGSIWAGTYSYDGIVIAHEYWGTEGTAYPGLDLGATATHEVGHWLGLFHPFEITEDTLPNGCACTDCMTCADRVCDTPPTFDPNYGYPGRQNSCSNDAPDLADQVRNYMDYADDAHMDLYTEGQKNRMHFFMDNDTFRLNLYTVANQLATGVGEYGMVEARFTADWREVDTGATIGFQAHELNIASSYSWTFEGGTPATSSSATPQVRYDSPGTYDVTLVVSNNVGTHTLVMSEYISVADTIAVLPFNEDFEGSFPPAGWRISNPDSGGMDDYTWQVATSSGGFGQSSRSASVQHFLYHIPDENDGLILPALDLTNMESAEMVFSIAYEPYDAIYWMDTLSVMISTDLGQSWIEVWRKGGEELATYNVKGGFFVPDDTEWRKDTADITLAVGARALVKFESLNKYGNNLYLDDVSIEGVPLSVGEEFVKENILKVFPNPFAEMATVEIEMPEDNHGELTLYVQDMLGKLVNVYPVNIKNDVLKINSQGMENGLYMLQLRTEIQIVGSKRIVIMK